MQLKGRQTELLAPARNCDIGIAAIDCGADAVYIAGPAFGARQAAGNDIRDIAALCRYAHRYGARIFITLNTILYDGETDRARRLMHEIEDAGADAVIVQDLAIVTIAAEEGIRIPLHASTQCAIRTPEDAIFYERLGFSRLVLERQLSLGQIREIRRAVSCELEFFVHGALCVCYSGQCYLSELIAGRSANRGACIQACRSRYDVLDSSGKLLVKDRPLLSLKDLNLKDRLADLADAGITSFKIEGRLKNISYVKNVVRAYSIELDRLSDGKKYCRASFGTVSGGFSPDVDKTFNRGYTDLFIDGKKEKWNSPDAAKSMGEEVGTVSYLSKEKNLLRVAPARGKEGLRFRNGDGFAFVAGSEVIGFRGDLCDGLQIKCKRIPELYLGARLYRNLDSAFEKELDKCSPSREIRVGLTVSVKGKFTVTVSAESEDGRKASVTADVGHTEAENRERMLSLIDGQLSRRSGHYSFSVQSIRTENSVACSTEKPENNPIPLISAATLNDLRRQLAEKLDSMPCISRPLMNRSRNIAEYLREATLRGNTADARTSHAPATYKNNISNNISRGLYLRLGTETEGMAYEMEHPSEAELMRTRYCIRHELGICPKQKPGTKAAPLMLMNNGRRLALNFDCPACEMTVSQA